MYSWKLRTRYSAENANILALTMRFWRRPSTDCNRKSLTSRLTYSVPNNRSAHTHVHHLQCRNIITKERVPRATADPQTKPFDSHQKCIQTWPIRFARHFHTAYHGRTQFNKKIVLLQDFFLYYLGPLCRFDAGLSEYWFGFQLIQFDNAIFSKG